MQQTRVVYKLFNISLFVIFVHYETLGCLLLVHCKLTKEYGTLQ